jgi:hypothetical protein
LAQVLAEQGRTDELLAAPPLLQLRNDHGWQSHSTSADTEMTNQR